MAVDCNQYLQRASKVEIFSNQWLLLYLKVTFDSNRDLAKVQKKALITKYAYFLIETCLLSHQNQPTFISKVSHLRCVNIYMHQLQYKLHQEVSYHSISMLSHIVRYTHSYRTAHAFISNEIRACTER